MPWALLIVQGYSLNPLVSALVASNIDYLNTAFINAIVEYHVVTISDPWPVTASITHTGLCHMLSPCQERQRCTSTTIRSGIRFDCF